MIMLKPKSKKNSAYGYSAETASRYVDEEDVMQYLDIPVRVQKKFDQNTRSYTNEVDYCAYNFYIVGRGTIEIRFPRELKKISQFAEVGIIGLLCWVNNDGVPYFKADDVEVIKEWNLVEAD